MQEQILPALARRFFIHQDGDSYRVAVVSVATPSRVLYKSDSSAPVDAPAPTPPRSSSASAAADSGSFSAAAVEPADGSASRPDPNDERRLPRRNRGRHVTRSWDAGVCWCSTRADRSRPPVASVRRRNLGLSFGMLLLLSVSVALLAAASRRAHRLAEQQMEFVAGVTHELRTPVAVIRSAAENLSHGVVGIPSGSSATAP
jgi:signal transduction histidine kinase